jgi:3-hydroxymyristoyl/3-hydroxydecanoyl-(acyl carrier protein) dehydratase
MTSAPSFDAAFLADLPYDPEVLLFDELVLVDREASAVKCRMPTVESLPFTRSQRVHPVLHPRHVAGAVMVHATGMLGFIHSYFVLGLRHSEGWVGYGTHIHAAKFRKLVPPGTPIIATCKATKVRSGRSRHLVRYEFTFEHEGDVCYEGDQSAMWMNVSEAGGESLGA